jgi:hypothetical protein
MSPPLEPAFFAEAIRRLGKNPDAPAVRRQLTHFAWADANGDYTFSFYTKDAGARLWIGGRKVLDQWSTPGKNWTEPITLAAGRGYPVKIEWRRRVEKPAFHLNWELLDQPVEHVPTSALYPELNGGDEAPLLPTPPASPGTHRYDEVLDARAALELKEAHSAGRSFHGFSIPLELLRLQAYATKALRGDVGVLIGNGIETTARAYWHNKRMTIVTDIPTEASLSPQHWGVLRFEKAE